MDKGKNFIEQIIDEDLSSGFDSSKLAGIIDKSGSWFSYGETKLGQGRDSVKKLLKDNPELCDELEKKIFELLNSEK